MSDLTLKSVAREIFCVPDFATLTITKRYVDGLPQFSIDVTHSIEDQDAEGNKLRDGESVACGWGNSQVMEHPMFPQVYKILRQISREMLQSVRPELVGTSEK